MGFGDHLFIVAGHALAVWGMIRATRFATDWPFLPPVWRLVLRALPTVAVVAMLAEVILTLLRDPTANILWPVMLAFLCLIWLGYAVLLWLVLLGIHLLLARRG